MIIKSVAALVAVIVVFCFISSICTYVFIMRRNDDTDANQEPPRKVCSHTWKDFPWYIESTYYFQSRKLNCLIIKPYVCIHCKERRNETLYDTVRCSLSSEDADVVIEELKNEYGDKLVQKARVEEQIRDMQLVDREALKIAQQIGIIEKENQDG